jgi:hypothetical protein
MWSDVIGGGSGSSPEDKNGCFGKNPQKNSRVMNINFLKLSKFLPPR